MHLKNSDTVDTFFSLLRSGMYGVALSEYELPEKIDWNGVVRLAQKHVVLGIIIDSIQYLPDRLRPSDSVYARMQKFALGLIQTNLILDKTAAYLTSFFKEHGITGVLLKGQGVARYYRMPQMRQCGDIDFYVGKDLYDRAMELCKEKLIDDVDSSNETDRHYGFCLRGVRIELHRQASEMYVPLWNKRFQNWVVDELESSPKRRTLTVGNTDVMLPSVDFDAIYIYYHAWHHYIMQGIGLRQLCDWAMIFQFHYKDIDTEKLIYNIKRFGMTKGWKLFASIAVRHLGVSDDKIPLYEHSFDEKSETMLEQIVEGGNFGFYSESFARTQSHGNFIRYGLYKFQSVTRFYASLFPIIPIEATVTCLYRLFYGTLSLLDNTFRKSNSR